MLDGEMERAVEIFRMDEFDAMLEKSRILQGHIGSLESMRDKILGNPDITAPAIHLANQHMDVISEKLRLQVVEMGKLVEHLVKENMVELQKTDPYHALQKERVETSKLLELFLPYVLLISILRRGSSSMHSPSSS